MARATRPAGAPTRLTDDTTAAEIAECLLNLSAAAKKARGDGNDLRVAALHRSIDESLEVYQVAGRS